MPKTFDWDNVEDIAIGLADKFPDVDPYTVRFTDMHKWVTELPGFAGDPQKSNERSSKLSKWPGTKSGKIAKTDAGTVEVALSAPFGKCPAAC